MELVNKVSLVTGGASGIGRAIASRFLDEGAKVCIADIDVQKGRSVLHQFSQHKQGAIFLETDVASEKGVVDTVGQTLEKFGKLDVVVNAAGLLELGPIVTYDVEMFRATLNVNIVGVFLVSKHSLPNMPSGSSIINIASSLGMRPFEDHGAYCASKAGVIQLTKVMALECAHRGIRVNAICPGPIETPMLSKEIDQSREKSKAREMFLNEVPLNRFGKPEEIANLALFLASDSSSYMTGAVINIDGGDLLK